VVQANAAAKVKAGKRGASARRAGRAEAYDATGEIGGHREAAKCGDSVRSPGLQSKQTLTASESAYLPASQGRHVVCNRHYKRDKHWLGRDLDADGVPKFMINGVTNQGTE
jgi:hypothetical protein